MAESEEELNSLLIKVGLDESGSLLIWLICVLGVLPLLTPFGTLWVSWTWVAISFPILGKSEREWKNWPKAQQLENKDHGNRSHTSWEIYGETVETVSDFIFWGSKITADGDCGQEIKRHLLLGRKVMTNLDSIFKSRDITLPTKVRLVKDMVFPVVMYGCEIWTVKKAECWRIDAFELWC